MTTFRHALILVPAALLLTGAKPADSLRATFADPGAEYRPVPFWHLNGRLSSDEIVRQIEDAKNLAGFGGVTVLPVSPGAQHPTGKPCPGMEPAYLSREYFDRYEEMLRTSERLGQKLIVYDDIDFPSGTAGGRLLREYPRYTRKLLEMQEFEVSRSGPFRVSVGRLRYVALHGRFGHGDRLAPDRRSGCRRPPGYAGVGRPGRSVENHVTSIAGTRFIRWSITWSRRPSSAAFR